MTRLVGLLPHQPLFIEPLTVARLGILSFMEYPRIMFAAVLAKLIAGLLALFMLAVQAPFMRYSPDGGATWEEIVLGHTNRLDAVFFVDGKTGWVVGENGAILHTTTGGF